eukprot:1149922-Pelagomonas_calceolata.AAC.7
MGHLTNDVPTAEALHTNSLTGLLVLARLLGLSTMYTGCCPAWNLNFYFCFARPADTCSAHPDTCSAHPEKRYPNTCSAQHGYPGQ